MTKPRILIGDDHSLVLEGIQRLLEADYDLVGSADDGRKLIQEAVRWRPDVVVLDISMPIVNGIEAAKEIKKMLPEAILVFISMHANAIYASKAIEAGASGYVLKSGASEELKRAIEVARRGGFYMSPEMDSQEFRSARISPKTSVRRVLDLTSRQRQILQLIAEGKQNKEIAAILFVSVRTVEFHRARLMSKLGARTVAELTRFALQEGLIGPIG